MKTAFERSRLQPGPASGNADGDLSSAGDRLQIDDNFDDPGGGVTWNKITLAYDANGNLTDDGLYLFTYDAWNRLVKAARRVDALTPVATVAYDALHRRVSKVVTNCGLETTPGDGGNTTVDYFYDNQWRVVETQNGSKQTTRQFVYGTQYVDEQILMDVNGDPSIGNDVDPDVTATGEGSESPADMRVFYHQDRNWNVTALTAYEPGGGGDTGAIVERYSYTPYGGFVAYVGSDASGNDLARSRTTSSVGAMFAHQGLMYDAEIGRYQNRFRTYVPGLQRFGERDPEEYSEGLNAYEPIGGNPTIGMDPYGNSTIGDAFLSFQKALIRLFQPRIPTTRPDKPANPPTTQPRPPGSQPTEPTPIPEPIEKDPCSQALCQKACKKHTGWGHNLCEGGKICVCICEDKILTDFGGGPIAQGILVDCAKDHEGRHRNDCPPNGDYVPNDDKKECVLSGQTARCVQGKVSQCNGDCSCLRSLLEYVERTVGIHCGPDGYGACSDADWVSCRRGYDGAVGEIKRLLRQNCK